MGCWPDPPMPSVPCEAWIKSTCGTDEPQAPFTSLCVSDLMKLCDGAATEWTGLFLRRMTTVMPGATFLPSTFTTDRLGFDQRCYLLCTLHTSIEAFAAAHPARVAQIFQLRRLLASGIPIFVLPFDTRAERPEHPSSWLQSSRLPPSLPLRATRDQPFNQQCVARLMSLREVSTAPPWTQLIILWIVDRSNRCSSLHWLDEWSRTHIVKNQLTLKGVDADALECAIEAFAVAVPGRQWPKATIALRAGRASALQTFQGPPPQTLPLPAPQSAVPSLPLPALPSTAPTLHPTLPLPAPQPVAPSLLTPQPLPPAHDTPTHVTNRTPGLDFSFLRRSAPAKRSPWQPHPASTSLRNFEFLRHVSGAQKPERQVDRFRPNMPTMAYYSSHASVYEQERLSAQIHEEAWEAGLI